MFYFNTITYKPQKVCWTKTEVRMKKCQLTKELGIFKNRTKLFYVPQNDLIQFETICPVFTSENTCLYCLYNVQAMFVDCLFYSFLGFLC